MISIVAVSAVLVVDATGVVVDARIAVGACSPVAAAAARRSRRELRGRRGRRRRSATVAGDASTCPALAPIDDVRGTADYRADAALTLVRRAIAEVAA